MSGGFTKLFSSIVTSTIWQEDDTTRIVWITLLALADAQGRVEGSVPGLAHIAHVGLPECEHALERLSSPDPYSRTRDFEGRRIEAIDGGWRILNYTKYRERRDPDNRREQNREAKRRQRDRDCQPNVSQCQPKSAQAEAEAEATPPVVVVGYPTTVPDYDDHQGVFDWILSAWNSLAEKTHRCATDGLRRTARRAYDDLAAHIAAWPRCDERTAREYIVAAIGNYCHAWQLHPRADRDWGLTGFLRSGITSVAEPNPPGLHRYAAGIYSLEAIRIAATRPDRPTRLRSSVRI
jgi:hypothetical protein